MKLLAVALFLLACAVPAYGVTQSHGFPILLWIFVGVMIAAVARAAWPDKPPAQQNPPPAVRPPFHSRRVLDGSANDR